MGASASAARHSPLGLNRDARAFSKKALFVEKRRNKLAGIAYMTMARTKPAMSRSNAIAQSGRLAGLDKSTGRFRADMALRTFSWDDGE